ncbi:hypothetical protein F1714_11905, partial [Streptococcus pneumoniae]
ASQGVNDITTSVKEQTAASNDIARNVESIAQMAFWASSQRTWRRVLPRVGLPRLQPGTRGAGGGVAR